MNCPSCGKDIVHPDYRHGHGGVCGECYDRARAILEHPAQGRRRPLRAVGAPRSPVGRRLGYEYLGHSPNEASDEPG